MNMRILLLVAGMLAGGAIVYFIPKGSNQPPPVEPRDAQAAEETASPAAEPTRAEVKSPFVSPAASRASARKQDPPPVSAWDRLSQKYGLERTSYSSKITSNLTTMVSQGMELADAAARNNGATNLAEAATREIVRNGTRQLGLTEEQQQKVGQVVQNAVNQRISAVTDLTSAMASEPENIMEMLLAGDALSRNEITREEYDRITLGTRTMLQNLSGFVTGQAGGAGSSQVLMDPETAAEINAILTPEQQAKLAEITTALAQRMQARRARAGDSAAFLQPGEVPIMSLEKMDQAVGSMTQMAQAARQMMEAMKGLKDARANGNPTP